MSYGIAAAFQTAIYQRLTGVTALTDLVGQAIFDTPPLGEVPPVYVSLGAEEVTGAGDKTARGARHRFVISVMSDGAGFQKAKTVAGIVSDTLHGDTPALSRGRVVFMQFKTAKARRTSGGGRRIDLRFEARLEDD